MTVDLSHLGTILGLWAHPDDEAYLMGGLMALAADAGQRVVCMTATLGDAGETADPHRWPKEELGRIRGEELASALAILGVHEHESLHLRDGTLSDLDPVEPLDRLVATIERVQPDTLITFGPDGMTGHPDHATISAWATIAASRAATTPRLLYATKTPDWIDAFRELNATVFPPGLPPCTPAPDTLSLPLDDHTLERKLGALEAHASQTTALIGAFGRTRYAEWNRLEAFRAAPPRHGEEL